MFNFFSKSKNKEQKPVREKHPVVILNLNVLAEIVKEISLIRQIKEKSLKYNKKKDQYENEKGKKVKPENILKPTFTDIKPTATQRIGQTISAVKDTGAGLTILGLLALFASPEARSFIWGALKEALIGENGLLPEPMKKFIKLFTGDDNPATKLKKASDDIDSTAEQQDSAQEKLDKEMSPIEKAVKSIESKIKPVLEFVNNLRKLISKFLEFTGIKKKEKEEEEDTTTSEPGTAPRPAGTAGPTPAGPAPGQARSESRTAPASISISTADTTELKNVPTTTEEIKKFQKDNGLSPADGIVGPKTLQLLRQKGLYPTESGAAGIIVRALQESNITSPVAISNILATVKAESNFVAQSEVITEENANRNYARTDGNSAPGDGFKYRGRGYIQHTGKNQYIALSKFLGVDLVNEPDKLNSPTLAAKAIVWFFLKYKNFIIKNIQDLDDITKVNKAVAFHGVEKGAAGEEWQKRAQLAQQFQTSIPQATPVSPSPQTGTTVAQQSADVVGAKKQEEAQKKVATNVAVVATNNTTVVPRKGTLKNTLTSPSAAM